MTEPIVAAPPAPPANVPPPAPPPAGGAGEKPFYSEWGLDNAHSDFIVGKGFKSAADLAKSAMQADRLVRDRNVVAAPDLAKLDDWEGWSKLGWDADFGKYKVPDAKVPDGLDYNKTMENSLLQAMHQARLPPHQAAAVRDSLVGMLKSEVDAQTQRGAADRAALTGQLKAEWGKDYDAKADMAGRAARALGVDLDTVGQLEKLTGAPGVLKLFAQIGDKLGEDTLRGGSARAPAPLSREAAAAEQRRLSADVNFMKSLEDSRHPLHGDNSKRWQDLIVAKTRGA